MSKADPYDNAPMARYFNTPKKRIHHLYEFQTEEALYQMVEGFTYISYNHVRPNYRTPYQARIAS